MLGEQLEAAPRDIGDQRVAVAEMPVGCGRTDPGRARGVGKGKSGRSLFGDQVESRLDQRLAQIAVMIAATPIRPSARPAHRPAQFIARPAHRRAWLICSSSSPNQPPPLSCKSFYIKSCPAGSAVNSAHIRPTSQVGVAPPKAGRDR